MNGNYSTTGRKRSERLPDAAKLAFQWHNVNWKKAEAEVNRLQARIAKATKEKKWNTVKRLQYLLTHSYYAKLLAVRKVTTNKGKNTPGIDKKRWNTPAQKMWAVLSLTDKHYKASPLRRVYIDKKNKKAKRPLGIPTMYDRAMQALYALALDPVAETTADAYSFGFRKGRCCQDKRACTKKKIDRRNGGEERDQLIAQYIELGKELRKTPAKLCNDKKLKYVRYADDFLIAVNGSKEDCEWIKAQLTEFIRGTLKMELSQEKTLITHSNDCAHFLGYDVRVRRDQQVKPWKNCKQRTMNNTVELLIPFRDKIEKYLFTKGAVKQRPDNGKLEPVARIDLTRNTDLEIVTTYDAELRGLCNFYYLASNYRNLNYFSYLMEYSCLKTLAWKHKCKLSKIYDKYRIGAKRWGIPYETKSGKKVRKLTKFNEVDGKRCEDTIPTIVAIIAKSRTTIDSRLKACRCELCGYEGKDRKYEVHHVNKVKNLKGREPWEIVMIAKRRKTLVVCHECHQKIHHGY